MNVQFYITHFVEDISIIELPAPLDVTANKDKINSRNFVFTNNPIAKSSPEPGKYCMATSCPGIIETKFTQLRYLQLNLCNCRTAL